MITKIEQPPSSKWLIDITLDTEQPLSAIMLGQFYSITITNKIDEAFLKKNIVGKEIRFRKITARKQKPPILNQQFTPVVETSVFMEEEDAKKLILVN